MPDIEIPLQHRQSLKIMSDIPDSVFSNLLGVLDRTQPLTNRERFAQIVASSMPEADKDTARQITETALSLYTFCTYAEVPVMKFIGELDAETSVEQLGISEDKLPLLQSRLAKLLMTKSVMVAAKANAILTAHENTFQSSRVFTDIRTVFSDVDSDGSGPAPIATVIVQMLKIRFVKNSELQEVFFALDTSDVDAIIEVLQRAKAKGEQLKSVVNKFPLPYVDVSSARE